MVVDHCRCDCHRRCFGRCFGWLLIALCCFVVWYVLMMLLVWYVLMLLLACLSVFFILVYCVVSFVFFVLFQIFFLIFPFLVGLIGVGMRCGTVVVFPCFTQPCLFPFVGWNGIVRMTSLSGSECHNR